MITEAIRKQGGFIGKTYEECLAHLAARVARKRERREAERAAAAQELEARRVSMNKKVAAQRARLNAHNTSERGGLLGAMLSKQ